MLTLNDVNKTYYSLNGDSCRALKNINLRFNSKGLVFVTGKSGSGKSTLLNVLGGLDKIDSGDIIIKNKSSSDFTTEDFDSYRNTYLGFVFQDFGILENLTVEENISLALRLQGYTKEDISTKVSEILDQVGLSGYKKRASNELSGGQLQRVSIARALVKDPEIILADEPTGNLDSETGIQIMNLLSKLSKSKLVIIVSHDNEFANQYADRIIRLKDGEIIEDYNVVRKVIEKKVIEKKLKNNDEKLEHDYKKINLTKTKLPFKYIVKSSINSLFIKKFKVILTLFLFVTSLFTLSISTLLSDFDISKSTINTMDLNKVDNLLVRKCYDFKIDYTEVFDIDNCSYKSISKEETEEINYLANDYNAVTYRLINQGFPLPVVSSMYFDTVDLYSPIKLFGFMEIPEDNIFKIINGYYPTKNDEVMITDYLVEPLLNYLDIENNELIGTKFKYGDNIYTITGVIDTDHEMYEYLKNVDYSILSDEEIKELKVEYNQFLLKSERLYSRFIKGIDVNDVDTNNYVEKVKYWSQDDTFLGYFSFRKNMDEIVNTYPTDLPSIKGKEIVIDVNLFINRILAYEEKFDKTSLTIDNVLKDMTLLDSFINTSFNMKYEYKDVIYQDEFIIKGFYIPNESTSSEYKNNIITYSDIPSILLNGTYDGYYLTLSEESKDNVRLFKELNDNGYVQISPYSDHLYLVYGITKDLRSSLVYLTIGLAVFSCVLIFVSISNSISEKQKDIGILRSIGTSGKDVGYIFLAESLLLAGISTFIAITIAFFTTKFINITLMNYYGNNILFFDFGLRQVIYITTFALFMTVVSTIVPITRLVKMRPIDVVRKK